MKKHFLEHWDNEKWIDFIYSKIGELPYSELNDALIDDLLKALLGKTKQEFINAAKFNDENKE